MDKIAEKGLAAVRIISRFLLNCMLILKPAPDVEKEIKRAGNYSDRRRSGGKRSSERIELALPMTLLNYKGEVTNISSKGIYFVVPADDNIEQFAPGKEAKVDVAATMMGVIVRNEKKDNNGHASRLGVVMRFDEASEHSIPSFS